MNARVKRVPIRGGWRYHVVDERGLMIATFDDPNDADSGARCFDAGVAAATPLIEQARTDVAQTLDRVLGLLVPPGPPPRAPAPRIPAAAVSTELDTDGVARRRVRRFEQRLQGARAT